MIWRNIKESSNKKIMGREYFLPKLSTKKPGGSTPGILS